MAGIVKAVPVADYGRMIRDAFGVYQGVRGEMRRDEAADRAANIDDLAQRSYEDPEAWEQLKRADPGRAEQIQKVGGVDIDRFFKYRANTALEISGLPPERQAEVLSEKAAELKAQGRDPGQTLAIRQRILSGDEAVQDELKGYVEQGYQTGILQRPPQQKVKSGYRALTPSEVTQYAVSNPQDWLMSPQGKPVNFKKSGQTINVNTGKPGAGYKFIQESFGEKNYQERNKEAQLATTRIDKYKTIRNLKTSSGKFAPFKNALGGYLKAAGIDAGQITDDVAGNEVLQSFAREKLLDNTGKLAGAISEKELEIIAEIGPQLGQTKESREFIIDGLEAADRKIIEEMKFKREYLKQARARKDTVYDSDLEEAWLEHSKKTPYVSTRLSVGNMPVYYYRFVEDMKKRHGKKATDEAIREAWDKAEADAANQPAPIRRTTPEEAAEAAAMIRRSGRGM